MMKKDYTPPELTKYDSLESKTRQVSATNTDAYQMGDCAFDFHCTVRIVGIDDCTQNP